MNMFNPRFPIEIQETFLNWFSHLKNNSSNIKSYKIEECLYTYGIGLDETLWFIFQEAKTESDFINYLNSKANFNIHIDTKDEPNPFTQQELEEFNQQGYIVLKNAISINQALETQHAIYNFLDADEDNIESWYKAHPNKKGMMVVLTQHQSIITIRQSTKIKKAYEQLYGHSNIYPTIDKVSFNPPITPTNSFMGSNLHWDVSLAQPIPFRLQGLIYLNDVKANEGAFHCVPKFHHKISDWIKSVPESENIRDFATQTLTKDLKAIDGNAGDMIIWHQALPHCATPNKGNKPRLVQYLTYLPYNYKEQNVWI